MTPVSRLRNQWLSVKLATSAALSLLLWVPTVVLADNTASNDPPPKTENRGGGSRGCRTGTPEISNIPSLILLTPNQRLGHTVATRPTFAWFVSEPSSWQMEFRLYEYDPVSEEAKVIKEIKDKSFKSSPGIMVLSPSESMPKLSVGRRYLWQVELVCNPSHPSGNIFAQAELKVVELEAQLKTELVTKNSSKFDLTNLYLKADLWYDALSTVLSPTTAKDEPRIKELRLSILEQVAIGKVERKRLSESLVNQIQR